VRVAALMRIGGRIVCVRHRAGSVVYHLLPGGGVGYRETIKDALEREVREETGLEVEVREPLFINDTIDPNGTRHVVNLTFAAEVTGGEITSTPQDAQVEAVDLIEPGDLLALDLRPPLGPHILAALRGATTPKTAYLGSLFAEAAQPPDGARQSRPTRER
jgi:8-oxo-dGTP diphosphatase